MNQKINVVNENGENIEAEVLLYFNLESNGKDYVIYTFGDTDSDGMQTVHASIVNKTEEGTVLESIPDDEWEKVKEIMREIIRDEEA